MIKSLENEIFCSFTFDSYQLLAMFCELAVLISLSKELE